MPVLQKNVIKLSNQNENVPFCLKKIIIVIELVGMWREACECVQAGPEDSSTYPDLASQTVACRCSFVIFNHPGLN
jgi:hypothetical protein